jgi:dephospho-CoA kinase
MALLPVIGILGGIGSGKSTVARCFGRLGCEVIDADSIAHELLFESGIIRSLLDKFGPEILNLQGHIDRSKLAARIFDHPDETAFLNHLIHPRLLQRCQDRINVLHSNPDIRGIVLDMPLLMEVGWDKRCDFLVFVECDGEKRRQRIQENKQLDVEQIKKRENFQISLDKKRQKAHYRVNNNSDESDMAEQVAQIFLNITSNT